MMLAPRVSSVFFFFNDTATTEIYTLSLHDALPIYLRHGSRLGRRRPGRRARGPQRQRNGRQARHESGEARHRSRPVDRRSRADRKSTRLNSSHANISYAVFCLKKKNTTPETICRFL